MDVHENARLTPRCRELLVAQVLAGLGRREVARDLGVSEKKAQKRVGRFKREAGIMPSMGSVGVGNAMAESFFATLERELLNRHRLQSQVEAMMAVFEWIEGWYNPHRRHSGLG